jgi:hypothetical protein
MEVVGEVPETHFVAAWVQAEYHSPFTQFAEVFDGTILPTEWATQPNTDDGEQNQMRAQVLALLRPMVKALPADTIWTQARANRADLRDCLLMAGPEWEAMTGGSRRVGDGLPFGPHHSPDHRRAICAIRGQLLRGAVFPSLISISRPQLDRIVVIEGNKRALAYTGGRMALPASIELYIGTSETINDFPFW